MKGKKIGLGNSKKGNAVLESITVLIIAILFAIISVIGYNAFTDVNADIQANTEMNAEAQAISGDLYDIYPNLLDNLFLFAFVLLTIFVTISVFLLDTHPIFFVLTLILLVAVFVVAMLLANVYDDVMSGDELSASANEFPFMSWVARHLVSLMISVGFVITIALFIKFRGVG